jgi:ATP/ADP translocase
MDASSIANTKQQQTVLRTLGHVVLAPIALIMIVLGGIVFSSVLIYLKLKQL